MCVAGPFLYEEGMAGELAPFDIMLAPGTTRRAVRVDDPTELPRAIAALGIPRPRPVIVLIGGAGKMPETDATTAAEVIEKAVVPVAVERGATLVDGGTDAGIMRHAGRARANGGSSFSLVGVAAVGTVSFPGNTATREDPAPLQSDHSHFVLVPGSEWGAESPWLPRVAAAIAEKQRPVVTVLINGGAVSAGDVRMSLKAGFPVAVVRGTGRLADQLSAGGTGELADVVASPLLHVSESSRPDGVRELMLKLLSGAAP